MARLSWGNGRARRKQTRCSTVRIKSRGFFKQLQSREREEPKTIEPSNLDPRKEEISKRNREARKRRTDWMSSHFGNTFS